MHATAPGDLKSINIMLGRSPAPFGLIQGPANAFHVALPVHCQCSTAPLARPQRCVVVRSPFGTSPTGSAGLAIVPGETRLT